ncbi:HNH endonuclease (plasmid) [Streptomyces sp. NBC_00708]
MSNTRDTERRQLLVAAGDSVEDAGTRFRDAAQEGALHDLQSEFFPMQGVSAGNAVRWVYKNGMVEGKGRAIYDQLMRAPLHERCPLCGHGTVTTLDHFLPKKLFPALCVDPLNLVPACAECNHAKGEKVPLSAETTLLHPYLDRIDQDRWLDARIVESSPLWLEFFVSPPSSWEQVLVRRTQYHFKRFRLAERFAAQANRTLAGIRRQLTSLLQAGGCEPVRAYLIAEAETRLADRPNGWEGVTYRALAESDTFCAGGWPS